MFYINFSAIPQYLKDEILSQCLTHDLIVEKVKDRIIYLLGELEEKNIVCDSCYMDYLRWFFECYKLLRLISVNSCDLISGEPSNDFDEFLKNVELRLDAILEKNKKNV